MINSWSWGRVAQYSTVIGWRFSISDALFYAKARHKERRICSAQGHSLKGEKGRAIKGQISGVHNPRLYWNPAPAFFKFMQVWLFCMDALLLVLMRLLWEICCPLCFHLHVFVCNVKSAKEKKRTTSVKMAEWGVRCLATTFTPLGLIV